MTAKATEYGPGKTDFCHNCRCYEPDEPEDTTNHYGTCRFSPPSPSQGFPCVYANWWCMKHVLTPEESMERLRQITKECTDNLRSAGLFTTGYGQIVVVPPVNADPPATTEINLRNGDIVNLHDGDCTIKANERGRWVHYPDVDGL